MLLEVKNLKKYFPVGHKKLLRAVDDVTLSIEKGETLGLVGESGCGKSTLGRTVIGLYEPTDGQILFEGKDVTHLKGKERKEFSKNIQMIFQDPYASLNPRMTVSDIIGEGLDIHKIYKGEARQKRIFELLDLVGLSQEHASRFPHEFSGGQRQRIGIARALAIFAAVLFGVARFAYAVALTAAFDLGSGLLASSGDWFIPLVLYVVFVQLIIRKNPALRAEEGT